MSFHFEFVSSVPDARKIVEQEYAPLEVKLFLRQALSGCKMEDFVQVKASGHLCVEVVCVVEEL
jgi:hypothetical protein